MSVLEYICIRGSFIIPMYIRMPKYKSFHFLPRNRTPPPLCLVQLKLAGYGTYWFCPHIIGKQYIKNVPSRLSAGYLCGRQSDGAANGLSAGTA